MCEYCDGQIRKGQNTFVYFSDLALGWTLELKDFEFSMMVAINYCPFCGRKLKEADDGND